tara:strand:+ start:133 stop:447 length:315 start_codon:yes stop_codon:yes gene_type:complete
MYEDEETAEGGRFTIEIVLCLTDEGYVVWRQLPYEYSAEDRMQVIDHSLARTGLGEYFQDRLDDAIEFYLNEVKERGVRFCKRQAHKIGLEHFAERYPKLVHKN